MAEQHVSKEQFREFVQRMEDRFDYVSERFSDADSSKPFRITPGISDPKGTQP